ncbi:hypothetical protein B7463_g1736, partial [Scytalidium lignicola]
MARLSISGAPPPAPDITSVNLARMIARLQGILITPDAATEARLRGSSYERERVETNLEYARSLLLRLEQDATNIKIQSRKQETQVDLIRKREQLQGLNERLQELNELAAYETQDFDTSEGEDLLGQDTPNETDDQTSNSDEMDEIEQAERLPRATDREPAKDPPSTSTTSAPILESSTLRARTTQTSTSSPPSSTEAAHTTSTQLFPSSTAPTTTSTSTLSTTTKESLLTHNRHEQEALTTSMLSMAQALKSSSVAFSDSLDAEKSILNNTTEGLEKNKSGLDTAQKKIGVLRKMSEGRGWWGRMMMYAWIFGLWIIALVIVFVMPKLRF